MATDRRDEEEDRRKRAHATVVALLRRVRYVCDAVGTTDDFLGLVTDLVEQVRGFAHGRDALDMLPENRRRELLDAAGRFEEVKERIGVLKEVCSHLTDVLDAAEKLLKPPAAAPSPPPAGKGWLALLSATIIGAAIGAVILIVILDNGDDGDGGGTTGNGVNGDSSENGDFGDPGAGTFFDPEVRSNTHEIGVPSSNRVISVEWPEHPDAGAFSVDWTDFEMDVPDTEPDLAGNETKAFSPELPDGEWYFHLRTMSVDGEWTSTVHLGPFIIEGAVAMPCPALEDLTVEASVDMGTNAVTVTWDSTGGCDPYSGTLAATYAIEDSPYAIHDEVFAGSGFLMDEPPLRCEGTFDITYELTLEDDSGQSAVASTEASVTWLC